LYRASARGAETQGKEGRANRLLTACNSSSPAIKILSRFSREELHRSAGFISRNLVRGNFGRRVSIARRQKNANGNPVIARPLCSTWIPLCCTFAVYVRIAAECSSQKLPDRRRSLAHGSDSDPANGNPPKSASVDRRIIHPSTASIIYVFAYRAIAESLPRSRTLGTVRRIAPSLNPSGDLRRTANDWKHCPVPLG